MYLFLFQGGAGGLGFLLPMILVFGVFYLLLIRPQQRKQKELFELAEKFRKTEDQEEARRLGDKLGRMVFVGDSGRKRRPPRKAAATAKKVS